MNIKPQILQGNAALMELSTECNKKMVPQSAWENYGRIVWNSDETNSWSYLSKQNNVLKGFKRCLKDSKNKELKH